MNLGASLATADILLFHHVDSELTGEHIDATVRSMNNTELMGDAFYCKFDERHEMNRHFQGPRPRIADHRRRCR